MRLLLDENLPKPHYSFCIDSENQSIYRINKVDAKNKSVFDQRTNASWSGYYLGNHTLTVNPLSVVMQAGKSRNNKCRRDRNAAQIISAH